MFMIEDLAKEGGSFIPTITFLDEDGTSVVPNTLKWSLTDLDGNVVNGRDEVSVAVPAASLTVVLGGGDLAILGDAIAARIWTVWGTYTSSVYGAGLSFLHQARFNIRPVAGGLF